MALQMELDQQNQVIDANQRFMDEVTASRAIRQYKIQELNRSKPSFLTKKSNNFPRARKPGTV